jgi:type IX secretion system PorP/SprF family membrane protein
MKNLNKLIFGLAIMCVGIQAHAQDPNFRMNQFNALMLNPAQAGSNSYSDISVLGITQWSSLPGAPKTAAFSGNFKMGESFGLGAVIMQDEVGPVNSFNVSINAAYHLKLSRKWKLAVGLKGIVGNTNVDLQSLQVVEVDPDMAANLNSGISYNAGYGFVLYSEKFYLGYSQPKVAKTTYLDRNMSLYVDGKGGHLGYIGTNLNMGRNWMWRPNLVTRYIPTLPLIMDVNSIFTSKAGLDLGVSYQLNSSVGAIVGYNIKKRFYVGYSYSYPLNELSNVTMQTHEIGLRYMFNEKNTSYQGPRFFNN